MHPTTTPPAVPDLSALLADGAHPGRTVPIDLQRRFEARWSALRDLGFELEVRRDSLRVSHRERRFEAIIELSGDDDLGEKRELFRALRATFGNAAERWFPKLVQCSPAVTAPYLALKEVLDVCQALRRSRRGRAA
jgi:hypothetical protein